MIRLLHVSKRYGAVTAIDDATLACPERGITLISGPSGSGKTTLLRLVSGLEEPDRGEVRWGDEVWSRPGVVMPPSRRSLGFAFQTSALWPHMTVLQNVMFAASGRSRSERRDRAVDLLERVGLGGHLGRRPHALSGGEARRVAVARALAPSPRLLLLDEPLVSVDLEMRTTVAGVIRDEVDRTGGLVMWVTHEAYDIGCVPAQHLVLSAGWIAEVED